MSSNIIDYNIELTVNSNEDIYFGTVLMTFFSIDNPTEIILDSDNLNIEIAYLSYDGIDSYAYISHDVENKKVIFSFPNIELGKLRQQFTGAKLFVKFNGILNSLGGLCRNMDSDSIVTNFKDNNIKRAFPCIVDSEATVNVTLYSPNESTISSNVPIEYIKKHYTNSKLKIVKFQKTDVIPISLINFSVA